MQNQLTAQGHISPQPFDVFDISTGPMISVPGMRSLGSLMNISIISRFADYPEARMKCLKQTTVLKCFDHH